MAIKTHVCLCRIPGQLSLEDKYRNQCYSIFLKSLQAPKPESCDELLYSAVGTVANGQVFRKRACLLDGDGDVCVCVFCPGDPGGAEGAALLSLWGKVAVRRRGRGRRSASHAKGMSSNAMWLLRAVLCVF